MNRQGLGGSDGPEVEMEGNKVSRGEGRVEKTRYHGDREKIRGTRLAWSARIGERGEYYSYLVFARVRKSENADEGSCGKSRLCGRGRFVENRGL
jgi:hypothetical protein